MHNTGNPLGSNSVLDLYDNSETIDNFVNSQQDEVPDRFGTKRLTLAGLVKRSMALRNEINDFSGALTFRPEWSDVPMNVSEGVGGEGGALNLQAEALGNRSEINKITSREALRRTYAEVGLNLVTGSFQAGFVMVNMNDVALDEVSGKAFSGNAGTYPAETSTTGFVEVSSRLPPVRYSSIADMISGVSTLQRVGDLCFVDDYYGGVTSNNSGVTYYRIVPSGTGVPDGGLYIDLPTVNLQAELIVEDGCVDVAKYGVDRINGDVALAINAINTAGYDCRVTGSYTQKTQILVDISKGGLYGSNKALINLDASSFSKYDLAVSIFSTSNYDSRAKVNWNSHVSDVSFDLKKLGVFALGGPNRTESSELLFKNGAIQGAAAVRFRENAWRVLFDRFSIDGCNGVPIQYGPPQNSGEVMTFRHGWIVDNAGDSSIISGQWVFYDTSLPAASPTTSSIVLSGNADLSFIDGNIEYQGGNSFYAFRATSESKLNIVGGVMQINDGSTFTQGIVQATGKANISLRDVSLPLYGLIASDSSEATRQIVGGDSKRVQSNGCRPRAGVIEQNWHLMNIVSPHINIVANGSGQFGNTSGWTITPYGVTLSGSVSVSNDVPNNIMFNNSFRVQSPVNGGLTFFQDIPVSGVGRWFQFGFWCKQVSGSLEASLLAYDSGNNAIVWPGYNQVKAFYINFTPEWRFYAFCYPVQQGTSRIRINFNAQQATASDHYIQNVVFGLI